MKVKLLIIQAQLAHRDGNPDAAVVHARKAEKLAKKLDYEPLCQRCKYWQAVAMESELLHGSNKYSSSEIREMLEESSACAQQYYEGLLACEKLAKLPEDAWGALSSEDETEVLI